MLNLARQLEAERIGNGRLRITRPGTDFSVIVTEDELKAWWTGTLIQVAMPGLNADEREFLKTGMTPDEWNEMTADL